MRRNRKFEIGKVLAVFVVLLLFTLTHPALAVDYLTIDSGTHDIDYQIGGFLTVTTDRQSPSRLSYRRPLWRWGPLRFGWQHD